MKKYKRTVALLLALVMCLAFCACGKSEAAQAADDLITSLGTITLSSESKIAEAEAAVAALTEKERGQLEQLQVLEDAKNAYNDLLIKEVEDAIAAIGEVTLESEAAINAAKDAYNSLDASLQSSVSNYDALNAAENAYFGAKVKAVEDVISAIGSVTLDSADAIAAARNEYDSAASDIQSAVGNYGELTAAEDTYAGLKAQVAIDLINAIGEVTVDSESAIAAAQEAYDALTSVEAAKVTNADTLINAAAEFEQIKAEAVRAAGEAAVAKLNVTTDRVQGISWYEHPRQPYYADIRSYVLPYIGENDEMTWLRLRFHYTADDWIFFEKVTVVTDTEKYTLYFNYFDVERDNDTEVWEWADIAPDDADIAMLRDMASSTEVIVRFEGDNYHYDLTVPDADKQAITDVLNAYEYMLTLR